MRRTILAMTLAAATLAGSKVRGAGFTPDADRELRDRFTEAVGYGLPTNGLLLVVDVEQQTLQAVGAEGPLDFTRLVSTAAAGTGNREGSNRTPLGWHRVEERIGDGEPRGRAFKNRLPTAEVLAGDQLTAEISPGDYVLTRILWLRGLQPGYNAGPGIDSHDRCIYLHGTNQEQLLGTPASHGCVRLANDDVLALFELVRGREAWCLIR